MNIDRVITRVKYFVENLDELVVKQTDPVKKAQFFGLIFKSLPTYADLCGRNQNSPLLRGVNPLFQAIVGNNFPMVNLMVTGVETLFDEMGYIEMRLRVLDIPPPKL